MRRTVTYLALILSLSLTSCRHGNVRHAYRHIPSMCWDKADTVVLHLGEVAEEGIYGLYADVRTNKKYPYAYLYILVEQRLHSPEVVRSDTFCIQMADSTGKLCGKGRNLLNCESERLPVHLAKGQDGEIRMSHLMHQGMLPGISDVGFRLNRRP